MWCATIQRLRPRRRPRYAFAVRAVLLPMLAIGLALLPGETAYGDMYQYTDADGVVHFTNIQPRGGAWKKVLTSQPDPGTKPSAIRGACAACDKVPSTDASPERFHRYDKHIFE